mmetsp:Transcript_44038/g.53256  ORF Transcript_44038/g.53256 Transcript_44038/m.53256 type:complete len:81 (+) Transcript_44038:197-439(+)
MSIFMTKKIHLVAAIVVLTVSMIGQVQATNTRRYLTPVIIERQLNATGNTTATSGVESLWTRSSGVGVTLFMGLTGFYLF